MQSYRKYLGFILCVIKYSNFACFHSTSDTNMVCRWGRVDQFWHFNEKASQVKILADKIPNFSEVSEDICWQYPKFQLEYPVLKTLWSRPSLSIDIVTSIFMSILRRSTPNSSHQTVVLVAVDYPIIHCYSGIRWLVTYYGDFCQLNLLKNSEIHWFQFIMNSSSHHTAMNYGSRSALFLHNTKYF